MTDIQRRPRLTFNVEAFNRLAEASGHKTQAAKAAHLGVSESMYSKTIRGIQQPSSAFIAAVRREYPDVPFDHLFPAQPTPKGKTR